MYVLETLNCSLLLGYANGSLVLQASNGISICLSVYLSIMIIII